MKIYLLKYRIKKGISTRKLAVLSNVSRTHIVKIENGEVNPTIDVMCKLAKALDINVHDLFDC